MSLTEGVATVENKYIKWFWTEYDILEIISIINNRSDGYVATTWRISLEIKERYKDNRNITWNVKQHLLTMEKAGFVKQGSDVSGNLIWELA